MVLGRVPSSAAMTAQPGRLSLSLTVDRECAPGTTALHGMTTVHERPRSLSGKHWFLPHLAAWVCPNVESPCSLCKEEISCRPFPGPPGKAGNAAKTCEDTGSTPRCNAFQTARLASHLYLRRSRPPACRASAGAGSALELTGMLLRRILWMPLEVRSDIPRGLATKVGISPSHADPIGLCF